MCIVLFVGYNLHGTFYYSPSLVGKALIIRGGRIEYTSLENNSMAHVSNFLNYCHNTDMQWGLKPHCATSAFSDIL